MTSIGVLVPDVSGIVLPSPRFILTGENYSIVIMTFVRFLHSMWNYTPVFLIHEVKHPNLNAGISARLSHCVTQFPPTIEIRQYNRVSIKLRVTVNEPPFCRGPNPPFPASHGNVTWLIIRCGTIVSLSCNVLRRCVQPPILTCIE